MLSLFNELSIFHDHYFVTVFQILVKKKVLIIIICYLLTTERKCNCKNGFILTFLQNFRLYPMVSVKLWPTEYNEGNVCFGDIAH